MILALRQLAFVLTALAFLFAQAGVPVLAMPMGATSSPCAQGQHPCPDGQMPMDHGSKLPCDVFACTASPMAALLPGVEALRQLPAVIRLVPRVPTLATSATPAPDPFPPKARAFI
jgi:hypothetical protein